VKPAESDLEQALMLGIVDYLSVPFDTKSLASKVSMLTRLFEQTHTLRAQTREPEAGLRERASELIEKTKQLEEKEESFRLIVENATDYAILMIDPGGRFSSWNVGAQRLLGYSEEEILGRPASTIFTPEDVAKGDHQRELDTARDHGKALDERWHMRKDGSRFLASGMLFAAHDQLGQPRGFVKIMRDYTERESARERLAQSEERYRRLVEEIQDYAIFMLDPQGRVASWNRGAQKIIGYKAGDILGRHFSAFYTPEDLAIGKPEAEIKTALEQGRSQEIGWRVRQDGSRFWGDEIITPIRKAEGTLTGFTKVTRDISLQNQMDQVRASQMSYLERISEISKVLEQNLEMEQVLQLAVDKVLDLFQVDRALLISPIDPAESPLVIRYIRENEAIRGLSRHQSFEANEFQAVMAQRLLNSFEPVAINPGDELPGFAESRAKYGTQSLAAVAMHPKKGPPWALSLNQCTSARTWTADDLRLLKDISQRLTVVLDNLILHRDLRASESRFRWLVENTTEIVWRCDLKRPMPVTLPDAEQLEVFLKEGFLAECNDAMARLYGYSNASEILGFPLEKLMATSDPANLEFMRNFIRSKYRFVDAETVEHDKNGKVRYVLNNLVGMVENGYLTGAWGTSRDITDRRLAEEEVRRSRDQLNVILQGIADAILVYSPAGSLVYHNEAASRMFAFPSPDTAHSGNRANDMERALGQIEILDEKGGVMDRERTPVSLALKGRESPPTLLRYRLGNQDQERWLVTRAKPILDEAGKVRMVISIAQDTTELRKTEEQFRQSQKMEAIGRLAGGVAHDFNNLLTAINGYSELLLAMTPKEDGRRPHIEEVRKAGERAASLTNQLLVYSRRQIVSSKVVNLNTIVARMEVMLRRLIGEDIELIVRLNSGSDAITADPGQIEQVILNLAVNSRDAMPKGGRLTLETGRIVVGPDDFHGMDNNVSPGSYVLLSVSDTGVGMEETVKSHLFEPFFTTKKLGQGTGLGLSTVYGIVRQSSGYIAVESAHGQGSTFRVFFPATPGEAEEVGMLEPEIQGSHVGGTETILVAEDDNAVRHLIRSILSALGYQVLEAANGFEALDVADAFAGKIDLLLTDVVMSHMGGRELVDRMKVARPDVKVLYMSGYTDDAIVRHGVFAKTEQFIQKPFSPSSLGRKVREILDFVAA
jgi:PAS domain S-box-containing protein